MLILKKNNYFQQNINDEIVIRTLTEEDVTQDYVDGINDKLRFNIFTKIGSI